ncbi:MAG: hypothetical protein MZW92_59125 [Comamonadaceae bacterium]|nr:hypothetical protein [Comamonadaceae bacterium]
MTGDYGRALKETAERTPAGLAGKADAGLAGPPPPARCVAGRLSRPNAKEVLAEHLAIGRTGRGDRRRPRARPDLGRRRRRPPRRRRARRPTRRRSPTTGPARRRPSGSSSGRS